MALADARSTKYNVLYEAASTSIEGMNASRLFWLGKGALLRDLQRLAERLYQDGVLLNMPPGMPKAVRHCRWKVDMSAFGLCTVAILLICLLLFIGVLIARSKPVEEKPVDTYEYDPNAKRYYMGHGVKLHVVWPGK